MRCVSCTREKEYIDPNDELIQTELRDVTRCLCIMSLNMLCDLQCTIIQTPLCLKDLVLNIASGESSQELTESRCPRGNHRYITEAGAEDEASWPDTVKCLSVMLLAEVQILDRSYVGVGCVLESSPGDWRWEIFFAEGNRKKMRSYLFSLRYRVQGWTASRFPYKQQSLTCLSTKIKSTYGILRHPGSLLFSHVAYVSQRHACIRFCFLNHQLGKPAYIENCSCFLAHVAFYYSNVNITEAITNY